MKKYCPKCDSDKPTGDFGKNSSKPDGLQSYCRPCKKEHDARHYKANSEAQKERNRLNYKKLQEAVEAYKTSVGCCAVGCEEKDGACLDFHHLNGDKENSVGNLIAKGSPKKVWKEIAKCVVICANHHRKLHAGRDVKLMPSRCYGSTTGSYPVCRGSTPRGGTDMRS